MNLHRFLGWFTGSRVLVYADFIDPFCYIGFHNLRLAAEARHIPVEWRGFEFNPDTPADGYALQTGHNSDLRTGMWASVANYAQQAGLQFPEPQRVPNTRLAHRLVLWAARRNVKNPLIERIYQAYFNDQKDVGDSRILGMLATDCGLSSAEVRTFLEGPQAPLDLERHREEATRYQFPGLPGFVFKGQTRFGSLSVNNWEQILKN